MLSKREATFRVLLGSFEVKNRSEQDSIVVYYDDRCLPNRQGTHKAFLVLALSPPLLYMSTISSFPRASLLSIYTYVPICVRFCVTFVIHTAVPIYLSVPIPPCAYVSMYLCIYTSIHSSICVYVCSRCMNIYTT